MYPDRQRDTSRAGHGSGEDEMPATETHLKLPYGIEWVDGRLIIADTGNNVIRVLKLE